MNFERQVVLQQEKRRLQLFEFPRANVLGVGVSAVNMEEAVSQLRFALDSGHRGYVCVTGVHGVMEAQSDQDLRNILNSSLLTTPDGMPTVWIGRLQGFLRMRRVFGPDFMLRVCGMSCRKGYTQFLYGGNEGVAEQLRNILIRRFPTLRIVGTYTPPFRPLTSKEQTSLATIVAHLKPDIFWVGLSTPKQERFMSEYLGKLDTKIMVGVGAAFDYLTGTIRDAPPWVKTAGLQWLHRLMQEPRRLWRRYLINNPRFLLKIALQLTGVREYRLERETGRGN